MAFNKVILVVLAILAVFPTVWAFSSAYAQNCLELGNCDFTTEDGKPDFLARIVYPYRVVMGDYIYPIFWGSLLGMLYMRNQNAMLTSFIGIVIAGLMAGTDVYLSSSVGQTFYMGYVLVMVSIGITIFILIKSRLQNP